MNFQCCSLLFLAVLCVDLAPHVSAVMDTVDDLAVLVQRAQPLWEPVAYSAAENPWPFWLGATPWQLGAQNITAATPTAPSILQEVAPGQVAVVVLALLLDGAIPNTSLVELELWPTEDPNTGRWTFQYSRFLVPQNLRSDTLHASSLNEYTHYNEWQFVNVVIPDADQNFYVEDVLTIAVPALYAMWNDTDVASVFDSFTVMDNLYADPVYAQCVFAQEPNDTFSGGWIESGWHLALESPYQRDVARSFYAENNRSEGDRFVCWAMQQPAVFNYAPQTWHINVTYTFNGSAVEVLAISWPPSLAFVPTNSTLPSLAQHDTGVLPFENLLVDFPPDYMEIWGNHVQQFSNWKPFFFPVSGRELNLTHKNAADPQSQLPLVFDWLEEIYDTLNLTQRMRMNFTYRNTTHCNLIVVLPGSDPSLPPILFMDHVDTAYDENIFDATGERVAAPGADDNGSAMATLLLAGMLLRNTTLRRTIWLTHITGEEYPSDDLGVRHLLSWLIQTAHPIAGVILMDMIAYQSSPTDHVFQVSAGVDETSRLLASFAMDTADQLSTAGKLPYALDVKYRSRLDPLSYLYNTDGDTVENLGFPVILFNEHLNYYENIDRDCYHTSCDVWANISLPYASSTVRVAIETLAQVANRLPSPIGPSLSGSTPSHTTAVIAGIALFAVAAVVVVLQVLQSRRNAQTKDDELVTLTTNAV